MRNITFLIVLLLALPLFALPLFAQAPTDPLAAAVQKKIMSEDKIHVDHLQVTNTGNGSILLEGVADLFGSRYKAGQIAEKVDGVKKVDNQIAVSTKEVTDIDLEGTLINKIGKRIQSTPFDLVSIRVHHGLVELFGVVRDTSLIDDAWEEAIWTPGVRDVKNDIKAATISSGDERLRQAIYQKLRQEYPQYFAQAHPSVIIIVSGGRVTLVGYVNSQVEQVKIASTIRSMPGILSVENQLKTE